MSGNAASGENVGVLAGLIQRVNALTSINLADKDTLATLARTGSVVAATAFALNLISSARADATAGAADGAAPPPHPGTAAVRERCENPAVPPHEFEGRFIATAARLANKSFDFIVVGAGSAGCVLARRLSMDPSVTVLLLECGGEAQNASSVRNPLNALNLWRSEVDWHLSSTPQPQLNGRIIDLERGKTLGGSSCLNYNMWVRSAPEDFERWATECGCGPEWSYEGVVDNFRSLEHLAESGSSLTTPHTDGGGGAHANVDFGVRGDAGQLRPSVLFPGLTEVDCFLDACEANGMRKTDDYNGTSQYGGGYTQMSVDVTSGRRMDAFTTFVEPVLRDRPNLTVASEGMCLKVLFSQDRRATGVRLQLPTGEVVDAHCSREVVLSAGAINSPHLLMLSGVGDARKLHAHGIPVVADVPAVGEHLQDHPVIFLAGKVPDVKIAASNYTQKRAGTTGLHGVAFFKTEEDSKREAQRGSASGPDGEMIILSRLGHGFLRKMSCNALLPDMSPLFGADNNTFTHRFDWLRRTVISLGAKLSGAAAGKEKVDQVIGLGCVNNHPVSRGSLQLQSADPHQLPLVDPALLRDPSDMEAALQMLKKMRALCQTSPLAEWFEYFTFLPGVTRKTLGLLRRDCPRDEFFAATDDQLRELIRAIAGTTWHYSCTARMGPADGPLDQYACDPRLRVRGVTGLRVADCSIAPFVVSANTNASAMMIGDKAAELIYADHGLRWRPVQSRARL